MVNPYTMRSIPCVNIATVMAERPLSLQATHGYIRDLKGRVISSSLGRGVNTEIFGHNFGQYLAIIVDFFSWTFIYGIFSRMLVLRLFERHCKLETAVLFETSKILILISLNCLQSVDLFKLADCIYFLIYLINPCTFQTV